MMTSWGSTKEERGVPGKNVRKVKDGVEI